MNEEDLTDIIDKAMVSVKIVPPHLFGHHDKPYMKSFVREIIDNYENEKKLYMDKKFEYGRKDDKFEYHCPT